MSDEQDDDQVGPPPRIGSVYVFVNGMVAVLDDAGRQIPAYQGRWDEKRVEILRAKPHYVKVHFQR